MKSWASLLAVGIGAFLVGYICRPQNTSSPVVKTPSLPQPLPQVVFEPDLKMKGSILNGHISVYTARNRHAVTQMTLQALSIGTERGMTPYPQYQIEDIPNSGSHGHLYPNSERALPLGKSQHGFVNTDLDEYLFDKSNAISIRIEVTVTEGAEDPKFWTRPTSVVYLSPWMPYKESAKPRLTPTSATAH